MKQESRLSMKLIRGSTGEEIRWNLRNQAWETDVELNSLTLDIYIGMLIYQIGSFVGWKACLTISIRSSYLKLLITDEDNFLVSIS